MTPTQRSGPYIWVTWLSELLRRFARQRLTLRERDTTRMQSAESERLEPPRSRPKGPLDPEEISAGIASCIKNAEELINDGDVLLESGRRTRALTCYLIANEELGKVELLNMMAKTNPDSEKGWKARWRQFRSHETKQAFSVVEQVVERGRALGLDAVKGMENVLADVTPALKQLREDTLYVDFAVEDRRWLSPERFDGDWPLTEARALAVWGLRHVKAEALTYTPQGLRIRLEAYAPLIDALDALPPKVAQTRRQEIDRLKSVADSRYVAEMKSAGLWPPEN